MGGKNSKHDSISSNQATETVQLSSEIVSIVYSEDTNSERRLSQNFLLIWLDSCFNENHRNSITDLRRIINTIHIFADVDHCIDFLTDIKYEKVFMIISSDLGQSLIPIIHNISQLDSIYILRENTSWYDQRVTEWPKVKGTFTQILSVTRALKETIKQCDEDLISLSFFSANSNTSNKNLSQLDQSFMYTQLFKETLLEIDYDEQSIRDFVIYYHTKYSGENTDPDLIDKFEQEYYLQSPIWWYTHTWFLYSMVNRGLRTLETDIIIKLGFFIRDLHQHIELLHKEQFGNSQTPCFTVYRGQGLSKGDFEKLMKTKDGLMSFNNFLSTSTDRDISLAFAESNRSNPDTIGVLFKMTIDPRISSTPFALLDNTSYFTTEQEILFSMHTVFRIDSLKSFDDKQHLWQVELTLTSEIDEQLSLVADRIRNLLVGRHEYHRLVAILFMLGAVKQAEDMVSTLHNEISNNDDKAGYYLMLGNIKLGNEDFETAMSFFKKALELSQENLPPNHLGIAMSYNQIGSVYFKMREYTKALSFYEKAIEVLHEYSSPNDVNLAAVYNDIGCVYFQTKEYSKALFYYKNTIDIYEKANLPSSDIHLACSYKQISWIYEKIQDYSTSIYFQEKAIQIGQRIFPPNDDKLANAYRSIGWTYFKMSKYSNTLWYFEKIYRIYQNTLPQYDPKLAELYTHMSCVYFKMREFSKARSFYNCSVEIKKHSL